MVYKKGALIRQSFTFNWCVWSMRGGYWFRGFADITAHGSSSDGTQQLWKIEIQSTNRETEKTLIQNSSRVCNGSLWDAYFSSQQKNPRDIKLKTKGRHHQWSQLSHCLSRPFPSPLSAPFSRFLRNDARIKAAPQEPPGKGKYSLFGKIPVFSVRVFDIHTDEGWSYSKACFFLIGIFFLGNFSLYFPVAGLWLQEVWKCMNWATALLWAFQLKW